MKHEVAALRPLARRLLDGSEILDSLDGLLETPTVRSRVQTLNLHHIYLASTNSDFAAATLAATRWTVDGAPIAAMLRFFRPRYARVTGRELAVELTRTSQLRGLRVALVGAEDNVALEFGNRLSKVGNHLVKHIGGDKSDWVIDDINREIDASAADIALVAVTPPAGELIAERLMRRGSRPLTIVQVGGAINIAAGAVPAAPALLSRFGLEWLWRFMHEPRRLWRRYVVESPQALVLLCLALRAESRRGSGHIGESR